MGNDERKAYLESIRDRYHRSTKKQKGIILQEFCLVCGYSKKYAITLLNTPPNQPKKKPGPKPTYDPERLLPHITKIWEVAGYPCSQKLKPIIQHWIGFYKSEYGPLDLKDQKSLMDISRATLERMLQKIKHKIKGKGLSTTKPGTLLKNHIIIHDNIWDDLKPGFLEADTVAFCGNYISGQFISCLTVTDILTTWTECRACWTKRSEEIVNKLREIEEKLPFIMLGFNSDNGSEFLNYHLLKYLEKRIIPVQFTRSRPYRKNDNAHVEQKNWTHARKLFGYERYDKGELIPLMNDLLANEWSQYTNHFIPTMKLIKKTRTNSKVQKIYDDPKTPFERVLDCPHVDKKTKLRLAEQHRMLNPFKLKASIDKKLAEIMKIVKSGRI